MVEFFINLGINMKVFMAAMTTVWTLLSGQGYTATNVNNLLEYLSCVSYDAEMDEYVVAAECTETITIDDETWESGTMDYVLCGDTLGEVLDTWLGMGKGDITLFDEYNMEWRTYGDYLKWEALNQ